MERVVDASAMGNCIWADCRLQRSGGVMPVVMVMVQVKVQVMMQVTVMVMSNGHGRGDANAPYLSSKRLRRLIASSR